MTKKIKIIHLTGEPIASEYTTKKLTVIAEGVLGPCARLVGMSKTDYRNRHPDHKVYYNANIFTQEDGKIWFGDIDLTLDEKNLKQLSVELDKEIFLMREMDGRFENEDTALLKEKAVWKSGSNEKAN